MAMIMVDGEKTRVGKFDDDAEAVCAHDVAAARPLNVSIC